MKLLEINVCFGCYSTGKIAADIATNFLKESPNNQVVVAYGRSYKEVNGIRTLKIENRIQIWLNKVCSLFTDGDGLIAERATKIFLTWADKFNPDILWLHNLHGYYLNYVLLFDWIKRHPDIKVVWTLHDCWAFTGHCTYFTMINCDKWKTGCFDCPQYKEYPSSLVDMSTDNYLKKKKTFCGVKNLELIVPSEWLANLVKQSFLKEYPVRVKYNEIDRSVFYPRVSDFRKKHNILEKKIILGVASTWSPRKGLNDFIDLSRLLNDEYKIVLVGLSKKQINRLPKNILGLQRTLNSDELACIYSSADYFVNPSKEETFGMTTLEALYCGTKAIVYKDTACEEIALKYGGIVVDQGANNIYRAITEG